MAKTFDESVGSNATLESIPGGYIIFRHMFTRSYPHRLDFVLFENVEIQQIGLDNAYRSVAGRKFYDSKIIFLKNIDLGAFNAPNGVF